MTPSSNKFFNYSGNFFLDESITKSNLSTESEKVYKLSDVFLDPTFETIMFSIIFDKKKSKQIFISSYNQKYDFQ